MGEVFFPLKTVVRGKNWKAANLLATLSDPVRCVVTSAIANVSRPEGVSVTVLSLTNNAKQTLKSEGETLTCVTV